MKSAQYVFHKHLWVIILIINYNDTNDKVIIVAEIGNNHEGNFELAMEMINSAYESGADAVKFQTFIPEHYVSAVTDPERVEKLGSFQLSFLKTKISVLLSGSPYGAYS